MDMDGLDAHMEIVQLLNILLSNLDFHIMDLQVEDISHIGHKDYQELEDYY